MRLPKLVLGFVLLVGGLSETGYFIANRNEFRGRDSAYSIPASESHSAVPVGYYTNLALAFGCVVVAVVGALIIRANWRTQEK